MPTYEYACRQCGEHLEVVQAFSDDALTTCPNCGGDLKKVFGNIGIVFKGSGFYKTDSRSGSSGAKTSSAETPSSTGADTKSASEATKEAPAKSDAKSDKAAAPSTPAPSTATPKTAAAAS
jgi:putative FmdB family regulatory protein